MLTSIDIRYLAFVLASEEGPLHELATSLEWRMELPRAQAIELARATVQSLLADGCVAMDQGPFAASRNALPLVEAQRLLHGSAVWERPAHSVDAAPSLFLTDRGLAEFDAGFHELSRERAWALALGKAV